MTTWWIAEQTLSHLEALRQAELDVVLELLPRSGRLLEIGAGTGWQAKALASHGYVVSAIDLPSSHYASHRVWSVADYDGHLIPFDSDSFDIVFSSNVLEHIRHVAEFQEEIHRVLKPEGIVVHVLPSSSWRVWTIAANLVKYWIMPTAHGEQAGNAVTEIYYFSSAWWKRLFRGARWSVVARYSNGLFYTGNALMDSRLSVATRRGLSKVLGGSCHVFVLREATGSGVHDDADGR